MNFIGTEEFKDFIERHSEFRKKIAYLVLSGKDDDDVVKEMKQKIKRYEFSLNRVAFDFEKINTTTSEIARELSASVVGSTYSDVYQTLYNGEKRGYKVEKLPSELIQLICDSYDCTPNDFIIPYEKSNKVRN